jgi:hypothetical protein
MNLTREEAEQRIEADSGSLAQTVYAKRSRGRTCYHNRRDCRQIMQETNQDGSGYGDEILTPLTRAAAQQRTLAPCKICVTEDADDSSDQAPPPQERYANLIDHS